MSASVLPRHNPDYPWQKPDERAWKLLRMAGLLQMTYVGTPFIYYGSEVGMWGANDPDCRKPMVWDDLDYDPEFMGPDGRRVGPNEVKFDRNLHAFFKAAIALRRNTPVLASGDLQWVVKDDAANTLAFLRSDGGARALVVFNRSESPQTVRMAAPDGWPQTAVPAAFVSDGGSAVARRVDADLMMELAPWTGALFLPCAIGEVWQYAADDEAHSHGDIGSLVVDAPYSPVGVGSSCRRGGAVGSAGA